MDTFDTFDTFSLIIGVVAVGIGFYELLTKQLIGRDVSNLTKEQIRKFLPYDVVTYIFAGAILALEGCGKWVPFFKSTVFVCVSIALCLGIIVFNVVMANKILGKPVKRPPHL